MEREQNGKSVKLEVHIDRKDNEDDQTEDSVCSGHSAMTPDLSEDIPDHPVDTGWAWVIMMSVFMTQLICAGMMRGFGVLLVAIQQHFNTQASMVSVLGGVESASFSVFGLLCLTVVLEIVSVRQATILGSLVGTCGLAASYLATQVSHLVVTFAAGLGVGIGLCSAPGFVLMNTYFKKRLPLAIAIANTGGSIGGIAMPIAMRMLLDEYFLSGAFLFMAGVFAQIMIFGALLRPPSFYKPRNSKTRGKQLSSEEQRAQAIQKQRIYAIQKRVESKALRAVSESAAGKGRLADRDADSSALQPLTRSLEVLHDCENQNGCATRGKSSRESAGSHQSSFEALMRASSLAGSFATSLAALNLDVNYFSSMKSKTTLLRDLAGVKIEEVKYKNGLVDDIDEKCHAGGALEEDEDISVEESEEAQLHCKAIARTLSDLFDPALFRSPVFWLLLFYHYTACLVCGLAAAYLPFLAQEKGLTATEGALLVTISGILDIVSRLAPGLLAQSKLVKPRTSVMASLVVQGVLFQLTGFADGMVTLTVISVVFGLFSGVFWSMMPLIVIELSGVEEFRKTFAFIQVALGASGVTGFPIIGYLRDVSGSYVISFHFMGACGLLAAVVLFSLPVVHRWEAKRKSLPRKDTNGHC